MDNSTHSAPTHIDLLTCQSTVTVTMNNADCWYLLLNIVITSDKLTAFIFKVASSRPMPAMLHA